MPLASTIPAKVTFSPRHVVAVLFGRVARGGRNHVVAPRTVRGDAVVLVGVLLRRLAGFVQVVGSSRSGTALVIDQREDVLVVLEHPVGPLDHLRALSHGAHAAFVERRSHDQIAGVVHGGRDDISLVRIGRHRRFVSTAIAIAVIVRA